MEGTINDVTKYRQTDHTIDPIFINRWSPRAMVSTPVEQKELFALFEAARWAPSSYNNQPWRFLYTTKSSMQWPKFFNLLVEFNQSWAQYASILLLIISKKNFENGNFSRTHSFDTGAAWISLALEGARRGLVVHAMEGFDYEKARVTFNIPESYDIEAMVAIGKRGNKDSLPESLREREFPSERKKIEEFVMEDVFSEKN